MFALALAEPGTATEPLRTCKLTVVASLPALISVMAAPVVVAVVAVNVDALIAVAAAAVCVIAPPAVRVTSPAVPEVPLLMPDIAKPFASVY